MTVSKLFKMPVFLKVFLTVSYYNIKTKLHLPSLKLPQIEHSLSKDGNVNVAKEEIQTNKTNSRSHRSISCTLDSCRSHLAPKGSDSPVPPVLLPVDTTSLSSASSTG